MLGDRPADQLDDGRAHGVPEPAQSLHVEGKPIIHSTNSGWALAFTIEGWRPVIPKTSPFKRPPRRPAFSQVCSLRSFQAKPELPSVTVGVGNNPQPIPSVGGTKCGSGEAMPDRVIPDRGQVPEYAVEAPAPERRDVLHDRIARLNLANEPVELPPEPGPLAFEPAAFPGRAEVLAGEPAGDDFDLDAMISEPLPGEGPDVLEDRDAGPVLAEDATGEAVTLAERCRPEAGPLQAEAETADAGEQIEYLHGSRIPGRDAPRTGRPARQKG